MAGDVHIVIFHEDDLAGEFRLLTQVIDMLDQCLARFVGRMGLAAEDELERAHKEIVDPKN